MNGERSTFRASDLIRSAALGLRSRKLRAALSAAAVAIGIAAVVCVLGITRSSESATLAEIDQAGTNMLVVTNGQDLSGQETELPPASPAMIGRTPDVTTVAATAALTGYSVFRTDKMPGYATNGLGLRACGPSLLTAVGGAIRGGAILTAAAGRYPLAVLGYQAAVSLGVTRPGMRFWVTGPSGGGTWLTTAGILSRVPLAPELDTSVLVGFPVATALFGYDSHPSRIYVRTVTDQNAQAAALLAPAAWPDHPEQVQVSQPSAALTARLAVQSAGTTLFLGLGAIAILAGGLGIANVMVISVLERRGEIGLRRALGASRGHVGAQFIAEAVLLSALGGLCGLATGAAVVTRGTQRTRKSVRSYWIRRFERSAFDAHAAWLRGLLAEGLLIAAGPCLGQVNTGIAIFDAPSEETARRVVANEPVTSAGYMRGDLRPYRLGLLRGRD